MANKLLTASLALALALTLSCGKDKADKAVENVKRLESVINEEGDVVEKFEYDDKNRLVKIIFKTDSLMITYNTDDSVTVGSRTYSKNGNIVEEENSKVKYTYDDKKSPFFNTNTPKWLIQAELYSYGYGAKNNILQMNDDSEGDSEEYEYEYDSEGFAIKQTLVERCHGECYLEGIIKYFVYSGRTAEETAAFDSIRQADKKAADSAKAVAEAAEKAEAKAIEAAIEAAAKYIKAEKEKALKEGRTFTDKRDGKIYRFVKIGEQTWMAENLNYALKREEACKPIEHLRNAYSCEYYHCYGQLSKSDKEEKECLIYGRYYSSHNSSICPEGWHLPSKEEWQTLLNFVGDDAGKKLKAKNGWRDDDEGKSLNGEDAFGFSALPGGGLFTAEGEPRYENIGKIGIWASSSKSGFYDYYNTFEIEIHAGISDMSNVAHSVRCVKDEEKTSETEKTQ